MMSDLHLFKNAVVQQGLSTWQLDDAGLTEAEAFVHGAEQLRRGFQRKAHAELTDKRREVLLVDLDAAQRTLTTSATHPHHQRIPEPHRAATLLQLPLPATLLSQHTHD